MKHTPTPWRVSESTRGYLGQDERDMERFYSIMHDVVGNGPKACIAEVEHGTSTHIFHNESLHHEITIDVAKANAELIIKAVNHHDQLVDTVKAMKSLIESLGRTDITYSVVYKDMISLLNSLDNGK
jgi:ribosomal protein L25 (general stress protein Ctc)